MKGKKSQGSDAALLARIRSLEDAQAAQGRVNRRLTAELVKSQQRADALGWALVLAQYHARALEARRVEFDGDRVALAT